MAALRLMGLEPAAVLGGRAAVEALAQWCVGRQIGGFQGRCNKDPDTCYAWWVGATLLLLGGFGLVQQEHVTAFLLRCQFSGGGFAGFCKYPDMSPDLLHAYYGVCWLSLVGQAGIAPLHCALGLSRRAVAEAGGLSAAQRRSLDAMDAAAAVEGQAAGWE